MINAINDNGAKIIKAISVVEYESLFDLSEKMRIFIFINGDGAKYNCMSLYHTTNIYS